ncbi:MAG: hypothetical protein GXO14_05030 [Thermococci archaeon]|nr:hypothetical protein [Thermococci archaeon]
MSPDTAEQGEELERLMLLFRIASGGKKAAVAWRIVRRVASYSRSCRGSFWECVRERTGVSEVRIKEAMDYLEKIGKLRIRRSRDGRHLYVLTLAILGRNPTSLDRWIAVKRGG